MNSLAGTVCIILLTAWPFQPSGQGTRNVSDSDGSVELILHEMSKDLSELKADSRDPLVLRMLEKLVLPALLGILAWSVHKAGNRISEAQLSHSKEQARALQQAKYMELFYQDISSDSLDRRNAALSLLGIMEPGLAVRIVGVRALFPPVQEYDISGRLLDAEDFKLLFIPKEFTSYFPSEIDDTQMSLDAVARYWQSVLELAVEEDGRGNAGEKFALAAHRMINSMGTETQYTFAGSDIEDYIATACAENSLGEAILAFQPGFEHVCLGLRADINNLKGIIDNIPSISETYCKDHYSNFMSSGEAQPGHGAQSLPEGVDPSSVGDLLGEEIERLKERCLAYRQAATKLEAAYLRLVNSHEELGKRLVAAHDEAYVEHSDLLLAVRLQGFALGKMTRQ